MKKMKMFLAASVLLLTTVVVFAGRSKFVDTYRIYGYTVATGYVQLEAASITLPGTDEFVVSAVGTTPVVLQQTSKPSYGLYYYDITNPGTVAPRPITLF